jgi:hypothetical protein
MLRSGAREARKEACFIYDFAIRVFKAFKNADLLRFFKFRFQEGAARQNVFHFAGAMREPIPVPS